jgi:signal transduction histidine kinase/DNA-binding response OmpR family regulator
MLKLFFQFIDEYGVNQTTDLKTKKDIRMLTMGLLIGATVGFTLTPVNWAQGNIPSALAHLGTAVLMMIIFRINKTRYHLAFVLMFIVLELAFFTLAVFFLPSQRIDFYFLVMFFVLHAFSTGKLMHRMMILVNTMAYFGSLLIVHSSPTDTFSFITPISLFVVTFLVAITVRLQTREYEQLINEQNKKLQNQSLELQKLSEMKSEFFANISHELRTPLTLIKGSMEGLLTGHGKGDQQQKATTAVRHARTLGRMIDDLLDISKLELGQCRLQATPVLICSFINRIVSSFQSLAEHRGVTISFTTALQYSAAVDLDTRQFEKVINNLLYNALKFSPAGTYVVVELAEADGKVRISIADEGPGIPEADLLRVFDRFYQSGNHQSEGSGLGLAIAKEITEQHGGTIAVENVKGKGAAFHVYLPKSERPPVFESENDLTEIPFSERIKERLLLWEVDKPLVLLVEDNKDMQDYLKEILSENFNIATCSDGQQALDWLLTQTPHLVVSDVMMPKMDGFELLRRVKENHKHRYLPFMLVTARSGVEDRYQALRLGVDDYIVKPFDSEELLIRTVNLIDNLRKRLKWAEENPADEKTGTEGMTLSREDEKLIQRLERYVISKIKVSKIIVADLADEAAVSERQLYRKLSAITGFTPNEFIMEVRLQYARSLLVSGQVAKIAQLADAVGIATPDYLSRQFYERFGKRPADYLH